MGPLLETIRKQDHNLRWYARNGTVVIVWKQRGEMQDALEAKVTYDRPFKGDFMALVEWVGTAVPDTRLLIAGPGLPFGHKMETFQLSIGQGTSLRDVLCDGAEKAGLRWVATVSDRLLDVGYSITDDQGRVIKHVHNMAYVVSLDIVPRVTR